MENEAVQEREDKMKVAVLGGGNGAHAIAADLSLGGTSVSMWGTPKIFRKVPKNFGAEKN